MKLIVGLGNPGSQYERTRHNAGFLGVDALLRRSKTGASVRQRFGGEVAEISMAGDRCVLLKPTRFMNCSGASVGEAIGFYKLDPTSDLLVLVDDYALALGQIRIRSEGSAGGHNGLMDIQRALSSQTYARLRIGIDPPPAGYDDPANWVLGKFTDVEMRELAEPLDRVCDAVECFVREGAGAAMNRFNTKPKTKVETAPKAAAKATASASEGTRISSSQGFGQSASSPASLTLPPTSTSSTPDIAPGGRSGR